MKTVKCENCGISIIQRKGFKRRYCKKCSKLKQKKRDRNWHRNRYEELIQFKIKMGEEIIKKLLGGKNERFKYKDSFKR